ncbi:hypothetical protein E0Z10_g3748 [Xylaria hypoxylon]|uniref:Uncharacterized protein n=1 Tax=Xylaria hypoxylon TaxID=37992 RepID=A0A4Z0YZZ6_9PEZI|nr:hypothetical protein E0Z10_g3748 [Xylaria hypoxylon]
MGGGLKSKFRFPVPGRSSKKQQVPAVSVTGPLSKAQRILGADGINTGSSRLTVDPGRSWETGSTGGISISISESSVGQTTHDVGFEQEDGRRQARWEEESAILPRQIPSAHGSGHRGMAERSVFAVGNQSRDNITNTSTRGRRLSSSTIDTHYDSAKMPLAISQQTSNSAMAKGIPSKVSELLDMDGSLAGIQTGMMMKKKKKPARLDLSRLRPKGYRDRNKNAPNVEPVGNNYVMRSPSFMAHTPELPVLSSSTTDRQGTPRKLIKQHIMRQSPLSKGITEPPGLHQLYHHYEQMSFQSEDPLEEEIERGHMTAYSDRSSNNPRPASTFTHSLIAPLPLPPPRGQDTNWSHSRNNSHDSRIATSITDLSGGLQVHPASRKDYAGSISSRHTRTSKASPSSKSLLESDRLQSSVLSLSDSSDDEAIGPVSSTPSSHRESLRHEANSENSNSSQVQQSLNYLHGTISPRKFMPSLNQVDEYLTVKSASRAQTNRSPSNNTLRSSQSSMSTLTAPHLLSASTPDSRLSSRSTETIDTQGSSHQLGYGVQEARAVSFVPLASTVEAASKVSVSKGTHHLDKVLRQNSTATSRISHSSDQPTPPLSPNSMEFYMPSRESLQGQAMASGSTEAQNARLMAVTRQEEMLLAALRQKRAKMRETVIPEDEENGKSRTGQSSRGSVGNAKKSNTSSSVTVTAPSAKSWPKRASSLFVGGFRENVRQADQQTGLRKELRDVDVPSTTSYSDITERTSTSATGSTASTTFDSRNDGILVYMDQRTDGTNTADSSVYFSDDYMEDSDGEDLIANERRTSRMQSRRDSASAAPRGHRTSSANGRRESSNHSNQSRKESVSTNSLSAPLPKGHRLQDVPEVEIHTEYNKDMDADDLDDDGLYGFPQPPMPPPSWPLPPRPGKPATKPNSPASAGLLHPSSALHQDPPHEYKASHLRNKRSMVRLSAVGHSNSPMPFWDDED